MKLGAAFQKVNFLRDMEYDNSELGRMYFPNVNLEKINDDQKNEIILDIENDFSEAFVGLKQLDKDSFFGVYIAYIYYKELLKKLNKVNLTKLKEQKIRISNLKKRLV